MTISTHLDVAVHLGHLAARHLAEASHVYEGARAAGHLDLDRHDYLACLGVSGGLQMHRRAELDHAMAAIVLFQATMEKLVCFLPTLGTGLTPPKATTFAGGSTAPDAVVKFVPTAEIVCVAVSAGVGDRGSPPFEPSDCRRPKRRAGFASPSPRRADRIARTAIGFDEAGYRRLTSTAGSFSIIASPRSRASTARR